MKDVGRIPESEASFDRCTEETLRGIAELRAIAAAMRARHKDQKPTATRLFRPAQGNGSSGYDDVREYDT